MAAKKAGKRTPKRQLAIGLDTSTQSLSCAVVDLASGEKVCDLSLDYRVDGRLSNFGIGSDYLIPPRVSGEADQPPMMFVAALDAICQDLKKAGVALSQVVVINNSGQQHGHVYLNRSADQLFARLKRSGSEQSDLVEQLAGSLSYLAAPIWMTSNTGDETRFVRSRVGGKRKMIQLSGSDAPLRFTGTVIRRIGKQFPEAYRATEKVQLISSLIPAILCGNANAPIDIGNACGMSLMDYRQQKWSPALLEATADGLPGGPRALRRKLPELVAPDTIVGKIARYFVEKYGFSPDCRVVAGSGDNPQAKVLVAGDLLSLGTSFVNMVATDGQTLDLKGLANAMYDGVGRPFMFGCRTNGAMVWDDVRANYGLRKDQYGPAERALKRTPPASCLMFWQPKNESFPPSRSLPIKRVTHRSRPSLGADYAGVIEASLAAVYLHSQAFTRQTDQPMYVTGGPTNSSEIMRRVAAIWNRTIIPMEQGGPALGAAVAGAAAFCRARKQSFDVEQLSQSVLARHAPIPARAADVASYHGSGKYLKWFRAQESKAIKS